MLKETGYQEKFVILKPWIHQIIDGVKKDLKNEHLKIDKGFCKRYFLGKNAQQVTIEEMAEAYLQDIEAGNVGLGEFIATRWLLKHADIYHFFEEQLKKTHPQFEELECLSEAEATPLKEVALHQFGPQKTYIFCVFNSVVFPSSIFDSLRELALAEHQKCKEETEVFTQLKTVDSLRQRYEREVSALKDRCDKKVSGIEKKYHKDMEALKRQISQLQKKLSESKVS